MNTKCLFLDRDGVINVDHNYVHAVDNFEFVDGIFETCRMAKEAGFILVVVTNQSGIGRGIYSQAQFDDLTSWVHGEFEKRNLKISQTYYCPHHPTEAKDEYLQDCDCRKPKPGMIKAASAKFGINLSNSIFIGDKATDMVAAESAGVKQRIFIGTGDSGPATETYLNLAELLRTSHAFI